MNRFINALLLFFLFPTMLVSIYVGFDLPIDFLKTSGSQLQYHTEILLACGLILLIITLRRSIRRWMGVKLVNQTSKFTWNHPVSNSRSKRVQVYTFTEAFVLLAVGIVLFQVTHEAWLAAFAFVFGAIDNIVFIWVGISKNLFRAGITTKAIIVADRDVSLIYFTGLRKISIHQQTIFFDYIQGLQLSIPADCIESNSKETFFSTLTNLLDTNKVFITKNR